MHAITQLASQRAYAGQVNGYGMCINIACKTDTWKLYADNVYYRYNL